MSWFNTLTTNVIGLLTAENPNKVLDVTVGEYSQKIIYLREESLVLYAPTPQRSSCYELVLHRPYNETLHEAYSLFRCPNVTSAEVKFNLYKSKIPLILSACKEAGNSTSLQKICDLIVEHPGWTVAHLVTRLEYSECLTDPRIARFINSKEEPTGMSPLQLAIQDLNLKMVQALLNNNASLDHLDQEANTVLHYAACTNKNIINLLCDKSRNSLNSKNSKGYTPLHRACLSDKPECVRALLNAGADVNITVSESRNRGTPRQFSARSLPDGLFEEDMKYGGTPLHWACSGEVVEDLLNKNCDINIQNFDKRTALHVMVLRNRLECLVALLSNHADCDIGDKDGNTALHLAVHEGNAAMVKALIAFGANTAYANNAGHFPRHGIACQSSPGEKILWILHAIGAPRCPPDEVGCNTGCKWDEAPRGDLDFSKRFANECSFGEIQISTLRYVENEKDFNGVPPPATLSTHNRDFINSLFGCHFSPTGSTKEYSRLLCLDGGGIRGLVLVTMLIELEKKLGKSIIDCFDWVAGTSTGGILALALSCGKTLQECLCLYFKMKNVAFCGTRPYASEPFENILKETFGEHAKMSSIKKPRVMISAVIADRHPVDLIFFRNYNSPLEFIVNHAENFHTPPTPENQLIWHAARATGAAPSYFRSFGVYLDGGLIANNPTLDALTEIQDFKFRAGSGGESEDFKPLSLVVSLGTGVIPLTPLRNEVDLFRPDSLWQFGRLVSAFSQLGQVVIDQATQTDGRVVDRARAWCSSLMIPYFRFSPQLSEDINLDEKDDEKLTNMLWETKAYMHARAKDVDQLVQYLRGGGGHDC